MSVIMQLKSLLILLFCIIASSAFANDLVSSSPDNARVYFIEPVNGETVSTTFKVKFGLSGMGIAPAGVDKDNTGHHHLMIDVQEMPDLTKPLPANDKHKHFGGGQTEAELTLDPGTHTLQLVLGNYLHIPHSPPVISEKITITVE